MKRNLMFVVGVVALVATFFGPVPAAHAHDVCTAEGFVPYHDPKTYVATFPAVASCTHIQKVVALFIDAEGYMADGFRTRGDSHRSWPDEYGGFWQATTTCAPGKRTWRTKAFVTAQQEVSPVQYRNDQDTHYSGTRWMECGGNGGIPVIDPPD